MAHENAAEQQINPRILFERLGRVDPEPFALLHRPESMGPNVVEALFGNLRSSENLEDLPLPQQSAPGADRSSHDVLAVVPFRQITERGFTCHDDRSPLLAIEVTEHHSFGRVETLECLPDEPLTLHDCGFDLDDTSYAELADKIRESEIGNGAGANFVLSRSYQGRIADYSLHHALTVFRRLLRNEVGAYWTFLIHTGERTFVGASPERHVSLESGTVTMNPISGTYRYPPNGPDRSGVLRFLDDSKETDELYMVVDEELKMMASVAEAGVAVHGPYLREMAHVAHTEYLLCGRTVHDAPEILRSTMFAPTVTGSPVQSACRVISRYESRGRGYYSGLLALIGRDRDGLRTLDAPILIRTAEISQRGHIDLSVGATLVRHSDGLSEAHETRAKASGVLTALGAISPEKHASKAIRWNLRNDSEVLDKLVERNSRLSRFWLSPDTVPPPRSQTCLGTVLVVDGEDTFTAMLAHLLHGLAEKVVVCRFDAVPSTRGYDLVVIGPGPGDARDRKDSKIERMRSLTIQLLRHRRPFLSLCLGHQILADILGQSLIQRKVPNQGIQREIELFGRTESVGFYNTFAAVCDTEGWVNPNAAGSVWLCLDEADEITALGGNHFASAQFHPESVLTEHGLEIIDMLLGSFSFGQQGET